MWHSVLTHLSTCARGEYLCACHWRSSHRQIEHTLKIHKNIPFLIAFPQLFALSKPSKTHPNPQTRLPFPSSLSFSLLSLSPSTRFPTCHASLVSQTPFLSSSLSNVRLRQLYRPCYHCPSGRFHRKFFLLLSYHSCNALPRRPTCYRLGVNGNEASPWVCFSVCNPAAMRRFINVGYPTNSWLRRTKIHVFSNFSLPKLCAIQARKCTAATRPVVRRAAIPATMTVQDTLATLPSLPLAEGMAVTFPAYLAIFLGTLIPCAFLVILYIQAESRKAGEKMGRGD